MLPPPPPARRWPAIPLDAYRLCFFNEHRFLEVTVMSCSLVYGKTIPISFILHRFKGRALTCPPLAIEKNGHLQTSWFS